MYDLFTTCDTLCNIDFAKILGTGHKVFTRGCGGYSRGVCKKIRTSKGGTKILVGDYLNLGGYGKKLTFIIMLNIKCIYIQI